MSGGADPRLLPSLITMRRQTRPFTVEIKTARKRAMPVMAAAFHAPDHIIDWCRMTGPSATFATISRQRTSPMRYGRARACSVL